MHLNYDIAKRYLFSKKSTNVINYITWLSVVGIAIGTCALVLILSVFNGFKSIITEMDGSVIPDLKVRVSEGKFFEVDSVTLRQIMSIEGVANVSKSIEEVALFEYDNVQKPGIIKGVDEHFRNVTTIDSSVHRGVFEIENGNTFYCVLGSVLSSNLSVLLSDGFSSINVYMPIRKQKSLLTKMGKSFKRKNMYPKGVFSVGGDTDAQYAITSIRFVQELLDFESTKISALEIKKTPNANEQSIRRSLKTILGECYNVQNRYEQDEDFLKIMNIEKWISFLIAILVLLIIAFNMVGSLWMMVLEKKKDIAILRSMGYTMGNIRALFATEGLLITGLGIVIGLVLAIVLYIAQKQFGLISIPDNFIVDSYPIEMKWADILLVIITVFVIGGIASVLPAMRAGQVTTNVRQE